MSTADVVVNTTEFPPKSRTFLDLFLNTNYILDCGSAKCPHSTVNYRVEGNASQPAPTVNTCGLFVIVVGAVYFISPTEG